MRLSVNFGNRLAGDTRVGQGRETGFTMVEVVVMMSIVTIISGIVLVSFTGLHEGAAINRSARELALAVRRAQNMSLAVTQIDTPLAGPRIPPAIGMRFAQDAQTYVSFGDFNRDNRYGNELPGDERDVRVVTDAVFEGNVKIKSVAYYDAFNQRQAIPVLHVIFAAPEAAVTIAGADGAPLGDLAEIELVTASGQLTKRILVRTSGQVSIR
ncbi:MAG: hypothetical protein A3J10_01415 [Candidatus Sungbacteria bacterium RIFCSPLOWO2_02_FULL_54_10]|uniref:General secretion pathway GspH domain-containing protein n=1 Tax=Candidatus Sungbacteria bacterium RIFCSPHIGHO2_02_FULL_53_17 TaxID=1802275 RepID=A0A1G2KT99_9BACT|nr:MAG: hypothetical protein A2679_02175 [Candidatus Sungbacteria bacterium RIFCSPHIGHO2_01_FULL_54_26]OHA02695.1 MAG: hypothetical protein A3C92_02635 [Candidatus Sungbacteria bacterium RIFCSPHIGHO2_02_FULL_53_17]OHA13556.1 MAG: hypothetical protein A3J10_01415 [Candidatus Sungbacteria bacterium RIFCSPLOWO2_02_FULL_54_10]